MSPKPWFAEGYERPNLAQVMTLTQALAARLEHAAGAEEALAVVKEWNRRRCSVDTSEALAYVRFHQQTTDAAARAERDFWNDASPMLRELDVMHARALTGSRHADAITRKYGPQLLRLKECVTATFADELRGALAEEARLTTRYVKLVSKKAIELGGGRFTTAGVHRFFGVGDRQQRLAAHQAHERFLTEHADRFDEIFNRLTALRDQMGKALGFSSYIPLAYKLRGRIGYGEQDVARFRAAIRTEIVPLCEELHARRARRLGVTRMLFHDELLWDRGGNPEPRGNPTAVLTAARDMYREIHPEMGAFMDVMLERDLLDVQLRDGKAPTGYCHFFADLRVPFVSAQFVGTEYDLKVLTHECGHAFQAYSARELPLLEYIFPTPEAAEVHSMAMELLTHPWMERLVGGDAGRYRRGHLEQAVLKLPYFALGDHFQHELYAAPSLSPQARRTLWRDLERQYLPWRDYGGLFPYFAEGALWQLLTHICAWPFHFIDYALAQTCALQVHQRSQQDPDRALADYLAMARVGGSVSFTEMLAVGDLKSPFEPETLRSVAQHARSALAL